MSLLIVFLVLVTLITSIPLTTGALTVSTNVIHVKGVLRGRGSFILTYVYRLTIITFIRIFIRRLYHIPNSTKRL